MKTVLVVLALTASVGYMQTCVSMAYGQEVKKATLFAQTEPEFGDVFYGLDAGRLVTLERQKVSTHVRVSVLSAKGALEFPGATSPIRFQSGHTLDFIVRSSDSKSDPVALYHLRRLESKKKSREAELLHANLLGASTARSEQGLMPVEFSRYGESSLKMTAAPLAPGEYAVGRAHGETAFCFGVD